MGAAGTVLDMRRSMELKRLLETVTGFRRVNFR
jgi:hypothetical protein